MTESGASRPITLQVVPATAAVCPYLLAADGAWRASTASRQHRCTAVAPAAILAQDKQRRLCLVAEHRGCSTYTAATALADGADQAFPQPRPRPTARPFPRTTPLVLDQRRFAQAVPSILERGVGQGGLVGLMAVAFGALVVARLSAGDPDLGPSSAGAGGSPNPSAAATIVATAPAATQPPATAPAATQANGPTRTLVPSEAEPTPDPSVQPPAASRAPATYTVKKGDTLSGIAGEFGTTWQVLAELNKIADPGRLRVGQVLDVP